MIEMHRTEIKDGMARMIQQEELTVEALDLLVLEPGGYHLMLMMPHKKPREGEGVELNVELADGQTKTVTAVVRRR